MSSSRQEMKRPSRVGLRLDRLQFREVNDRHIRARPKIRSYRNSEHTLQVSILAS